MTDTMFYVASWPDELDAAFAATVDELKYVKDNAKVIADWIVRGAVVTRVNAEQGKAMMNLYCQRHRQ